MQTIQRALMGPAMLVLACFGPTPCANGAEPGLGHPDFHPTPERPIGWRGDGNGAFPGATLVDRFGDGPLTRVAPPAGTEGGDFGEKNVPKDFIALGKPAPVNVVWKVPLPGYTQAQPIIVGHRVIQTCEPGLILCFDIHTGKEQWRYDLDVLLLQKLPPAEIERARRLRGVIRTMQAIKSNLAGNYNRLGGATDEKLALWKERAELLLVLAKQAQELGANGEAVALIEKILATLRSAQPAADDLGLSKAFNNVLEPLLKGFSQQYGTYANSHWYPYVGDTWPTPVCDGLYLYVYTSQGAVVCLDLDGKPRWVQRLTPPKSVAMPRAVSPLLADGVLIVPFFTTHAFEAASGKELWSSESGGPKLVGGNSCLNPVVMRLTDGRAVLATCGKEAIWIIDPATGKTLLKQVVQEGAHDGGPSLMAQGDILFSPFNGWAGRLSGSGTSLTLQELWTTKPSGTGSHILAGNQVFVGNSSLDLESGKELAKAGKPAFTGGWKPSVAVGDRILSVQDASCSNYGCKGPELMPFGTSMSFAVLGMDGKTISQDNLLNTALPATAPWIAEVARPLYEAGHLNDMNGGVPSNFGFGPAFAQGNRLVMPGLSHLWCIGDPSKPYNGTAGPGAGHAR